MQRQDDTFGLCPICHKTDGCASAGKLHWYYCKEHKTSWHVGTNLFSGWRYQTEEEQRRIWDEIGLNEFEDVEPYFPPTREGLAARADDSEVILLVRHNGKWVTFEGHQEIHYAYGREQVPSQPVTDEDCPF